MNFDAARENANLKSQLESLQKNLDGFLVGSSSAPSGGSKSEISDNLTLKPLNNDKCRNGKSTNVVPSNGPLPDEQLIQANTQIASLNAELTKSRLVLILYQSRTMCFVQVLR